MNDNPITVALSKEEARRIKQRAWTAKWRAKNMDRISAYMKAYYAITPKSVLAARNKKSKEKKRAENPKFFADQVREWRARNREKWNVIAARSKRKRYNNSEKYRMTQVLKGAVTRVLRVKGIKKAQKIEALLGCTVEQLKTYLESKFAAGMTWGNRGKFGWHLDHVRPCASFNLSDPEQQKQCFHYTNLQPLWWRDNILKKDKWIRLE